MRSTQLKVLTIVLVVAAALSFAVAGSGAADAADNGYTEKYGFGDHKYTDVTVTSFTFPESKGVPVYDAIEDATDSIHIAIYQLTSPNLVLKLVEKAKAGVDVKVIVDENPTAYDVEKNEFPLLKNLSDAGAGVYVIGTSTGNTWQNFHNKYAVIDGDEVVITSENWTVGNMEGKGNRGWGAVVESKGYAGFMESMFQHDLKMDDVSVMTEKYPNLKNDDLPDSYKDYKIDSSLTSTYTATVTAASSPDCSFSAQKVLFSKVGEGNILYVEQLSYGGTINDLGKDSPAKWMKEAADKGADVRFLLADSEGDDDQKAVDELNSVTKVKAKVISNKTVPSVAFSTMHNKGIIFDDAVWVGSVNWTTTSFEKNRETAVLIQAPEAVDFYKAAYDTDFGAVTDDLGRADGKIYYHIDLENGKNGTAAVNVGTAPAGETVTVTADPDDGYKVSKVTCGDVEVTKVDDGTYTFVMPDESVTVTVTYEEDDSHDLLYYIALAVVVILAIIGALMKTKKKSSRSKRKGSKKRRRRRRQGAGRPCGLPPLRTKETAAFSALHDFG